MTYQESYQTWLDFADLPDYLREELVAMDEKTKEDAFYTNLEFGTAGMRVISVLVLTALTYLLFVKLLKVWPSW